MIGFMLLITYVPVDLTLAAENARVLRKQVRPFPSGSPNLLHKQTAVEKKKGWICRISTPIFFCAEESSDTKLHNSVF